MATFPHGQTGPGFIAHAEHGRCFAGGKDRDDALALRIRFGLAEEVVD